MRPQGPSRDPSQPRPTCKCPTSELLHCHTLTHARTRAHTQEKCRLGWEVVCAGETSHHWACSAVVGDPNLPDF